MAPKKSQHFVPVEAIYSSDEEAGAFPEHLLAEAKEDVWQSPVKATKAYRIDLKPRVAAKRKRPNNTAPVQALEDVAAGPSVQSELWANDLGFSGGDGGWNDGGLGEGMTAIEDSGSRAPTSEAVTPGEFEFLTEQLLYYHSVVRAGAAGIGYIEDNVFAVEGWNVHREQATGLWYHLEYLVVEGEGQDAEELAVGCTCPAGLREGYCIHIALVKRFDVRDIRGYAQAVASDELTITMFYRERIEESDEFLTLFSVRSHSQTGAKGRALVKHLGNCPSTGQWTCSKSHTKKTKCAHVPAATKVLREALKLPLDAPIDETLGGLDLGALENGAEGAPVVATGSEALIIPLQKSPAMCLQGSVSYRPILPPLSYILPSDETLYPRPPPFRNAPAAPFPLELTSTCPCPLPLRSSFDPQRKPSREVHPCRVYTVLGCYTAQIELQPCPNCYSRGEHFIGPDLREVGLFNYDNTTLVSHELLDEYMVAYSSSETPFTAFVAQMSHRYSSTTTRFMRSDLFRPVWFAYVSVQAFEKDMSCVRCGTSPETVIWDGVTVAFDKNRLASTLAPPTQLTSQSFRRPLVKNKPGQQLIKDATLRKQIRAIIATLKDRVQATAAEDSYNDSGIPQDTAIPSEAIEAPCADTVLSDTQRIDEVLQSLSSLCPAVCTLFMEFCGYTAYAKRRPPPPLFRSFFLQIAAEESVLQMVNGSALRLLQVFIENPRHGQITQLLGIPGIYLLLRKYPGRLHAMVPILRWIAERAVVVFEAVRVDSRLIPIISDAQASALNWRLTGCFYSLPQLRFRPCYENLISDRTKVDSSRGGDTCGKYFSEYGEATLTGGIMAAWCTHSVCYGFHCIPSSEGRNDVFSALITRWPVAPKRIIYDFACALGPYCLLREPEFFKDTVFVIDKFHSMGHTKCSPAAFLQQYSDADPRLIHINSSAGESGNSSLKRIRKSLRYMTQDHAIIYTKVFLSMWNRARLLKKKL
ncbi:hypothetical protein D9611_012830 [Ephemerocybe angulata]|uniref:SWIM-type domain-containing protein n=1 Tax=Ephemerocybe angulata TaxID=980116 RepID=A0A8H5BAQ4_9AGAR|nr:hypothetical protein D9611_012830 [Tulosesus angulatus]